MASIAGHLRIFHRPYIKWFYDRGYEVHVACNGEFEDPHVTKFWNIPFERSPWSLSHATSLRRLSEIVNQQEFILITCHTPMASVITRLAAWRARKKGTRVIYTAHGFHFFKGSGIFSWLTYYPVERLLSCLTDAIVCINQEDFDFIRQKGNSNVIYHLIPGIGVDSTRFYPVTASKKIALRNSFGLNDNAFVVVYVAEFNENKNHRLVVDAVDNLIPEIKGLKIIFAGYGALIDEIKTNVQERGLKNYFFFPGFVDRIEHCYQISDLIISSSRREGLGLNLVEGMMCGVPVVATINRGHCTIIDDGLNGYLVPQGEPSSFADAILKLYRDPATRLKMSKNAVDKASNFEISKSLASMSAIYTKYIGTSCNS